MDLDLLQSQIHTFAQSARVGSKLDGAESKQIIFNSKISSLKSRLSDLDPKISDVRDSVEFVAEANRNPIEIR